MSIDALGRRLWQAVSPVRRAAFFSCLIAGYLCHLYAFTNLIPNSDGLSRVFDPQQMTVSGRWFLHYASALNGFTQMPAVIGLLSLLFLALAAALVTDVLGLRSRVLAGLTGAVMALFPCVGYTFLYLFTASAYCLAIFLAVLSVWLARRGDLGWPFGVMALADTLRPDAAETIWEVKGAGVQPVLLTGDHPSAAGHIAALLNIREVKAGCLPEDKLNWIARAQEEGRPVCMIGDGINDAPALKRAMVGIAMGGVGSDIAVDAADMALVGDDLRQLPHLLRLARRMMVTIKCNLTFSMALNFAAIALAITGILNPVVGALVHNAGSVVVIVNSALLLRWHKRA